MTYTALTDAERADYASRIQDASIDRAIATMDARLADSAIGAQSSLVGATDGLEAALSAGIPIGDLLAAQALRHGRAY
jgi:hypothetical protein